MKSQELTKRQLILTLDEREIRYLQELTRNHLGPGKEDGSSMMLRKSFYQATVPGTN